MIVTHGFNVYVQLKSNTCYIKHFNYTLCTDVYMPSPSALKQNALLQYQTLYSSTLTHCEQLT